MSDFDRPDTTTVGTSTLSNSSVSRQFATHIQAAIELAESCGMYLHALNEEQAREAQEMFAELLIVAQDGMERSRRRVEKLNEPDPSVVWISVYKAAEILGVSADEVLTLAQVGRLESRMTEGAFRVAEHAVLEFRGETGLLEFSELSEVSESEEMEVFEDYQAASESYEADSSDVSEELDFVDQLLALDDLEGELDGAEEVSWECNTGNHPVIADDAHSCATIQVEDAMVVDEMDELDEVLELGELDLLDEFNALDCAPDDSQSINRKDFANLIEEMISEGVEDSVFVVDPPTRKVHALMSDSPPPVPGRRDDE